MHDLTYANQIIDALKKASDGKDKTASMSVDVSLSSFSHVTPQRLRDIFLIFAEEEGFRNTKLNIHTAAFCVHCKKCGKTWRSAKPTFKCPHCDGDDFELEPWEEFYVESVKIG